MNNYMIMRRAGWQTDEEVHQAAARSRSTREEEFSKDIRWIRSYLVKEPDGSIGSICIYQATSPDVIREHAKRAGLPADEILPIDEAIVEQPDPEPAHA
jgi:Protein of unknown function (DUF4242)